MELSGLTGIESVQISFYCQSTSIFTRQSQSKVFLREIFFFTYIYLKNYV